MSNFTNTPQGGHVLIFDSGLGGTTVLQELQKSLNHCSYSYALDNAAFPYGEQTDGFLLRRSTQLFQQLIHQDKPDIVVIACNTASTLFLDSLRQQFPNVDFIGVVPAIKPAAQLSANKTIALLATPATIVRPYIDDLHQQFAKDCQLIRLAHKDLAVLAEEKIRFNRSVQAAITAIVNELQQQYKTDDIDTIVLGCTHYPVILNELQNAWGKRVHWIDSGQAIARRARQLIERLTSNQQRNSKIYLTAHKDQTCIAHCLDKYLPQASIELIHI